MYIDDGRDTVAFKDLDFGKSFWFEGAFYMKINNSVLPFDCTFNAIVLGNKNNETNTGWLCVFSLSTEVEVVEIEGKVVR